MTYEDIKKHLVEASGIASCVLKQTDGKEINLIEGNAMHEQHCAIMNLLMSEFVLEISRIASESGCLEALDDPNYLILSLRSYENCINEEVKVRFDTIVSLIEEACGNGKKGGSVPKA